MLRGEKLKKGCRVCGRESNIPCFRYGAITCSACATFFFRAVSRKIPYSCTHYNGCKLITNKQGTACKKCRLQKCIEAGMRLPGNLKKASHPVKDEYLTLANKLNNLLIICKKCPDLLVKYLKNDDDELIQEATKLLDDKRDEQFLDSWATILRQNQVSLEKIYVLFYEITCKIQFPWMSEKDQEEIKRHQSSAAQRNLTSEAYGSDVIKEGFGKLSNFFCNYFQTQK